MPDIYRIYKFSCDNGDTLALQEAGSVHGIREWGNKVKVTAITIIDPTVALFPVEYLKDITQVDTEKEHTRRLITAKRKIESRKNRSSSKRDKFTDA